MWKDKITNGEKSLNFKTYGFIKYCQRESVKLSIKNYRKLLHLIITSSWNCYKSIVHCEKNVKNGS